MDVRARKTIETIKIGVMDVGEGHFHTENVVSIIKHFVPNAEIIVTNTFKDGVERQLEERPAIINLSMANMAFGRQMDDLATTTFLITSAGNDGDKGETGAARQNRWMAVGAVDENMVPKSYSSFGGGHVKTVAVPFMRIGTSYSAPVITGLLAQWYIWYNQNIGIYPSIQATNQFIRQNSHDIWEDGKDLQTGWGLFRLPHRFEATKIIIEPDNQIAKKIKYVEGEKPVESTIDLLVKPTVIDQRILIPLRGVNEGLGLTVDWINRQAIVIGG